MDDATDISTMKPTRIWKWTCFRETLSDYNNINAPIICVSLIQKSKIEFRGWKQQWLWIT